MNDIENKGEITPVDKNVSDETNVLEWRCHPATRKPWVTLGVSVFVLVISMLVFAATDSKGFSFLSLLVMFASLAKYYFPTCYRMTDEKISIKTTTQTLHKEWKIFRSFYPDKNGVLLSPFVRPTRMENFRGLYVMFSNNRDEVMEYVKAHINTNPPEKIEEEKK
ncbi:MAG: hypothetical protein ABIJ12_00160 [bacterium]